MARARSGIYLRVSAESSATGIPNNPKLLRIQPGHHVVVRELTLDPISLRQPLREAFCRPVPQQLPPPAFGWDVIPKGCWGVQGTDVLCCPGSDGQHPRNCLGISMGYDCRERPGGAVSLRHDPLAIGPLPPPYHGHLPQYPVFPPDTGCAYRKLPGTA